MGTRLLHYSQLPPHVKKLDTWNDKYSLTDSHNPNSTDDMLDCSQEYSGMNSGKKLPHLTALDVAHQKVLERRTGI